MADLSIFDLTGKKALVTGGSTGIGRACAIGMAKAGADVAIIDIKDETGQETVKSIKAVGRKSSYIRCDVTDPKQVANMVKQVVKEFGRLDIAFNNAGIGGLGNASIDDDAIEVWHKIMNINLHIERLVLDGVNIAPGQRHLLQASVETELTRLLSNGGLTPAFIQGLALPRITVKAIQLPGNNATQIGQRIAQSVYGGIGDE